MYYNMIECYNNYVDKHNDIFYFFEFKLPEA